MRIECNKCGKKAIITSSKKFSENTRKLYCACSDAECRHTFSMMLTFDKTLLPPAEAAPREALG